jgi:hypothetical protein
MKKLEVGEKVYFKSSGRYSDLDFTVTEIVRLTKTLAITKEGERFRNNATYNGGFKQFEARGVSESATYLYRLTPEAQITINEAKEVIKLKSWWAKLKNSIRTVDDIKKLYNKIEV